MVKWLKKLKNKCTECLRAVAPVNVKSHLSVLTLNHAPTSILSKLPMLETALIKNVVMGPQAESRTLRIARPLVKRMITRGRADDKKRLEQVFGRYTRHYPDLESFLFCSELAKYTNKFQSSRSTLLNRKKNISSAIAKESFKYLQSYILYICRKSHAYDALENHLPYISFPTFLNLKGISPKILEIIKNQDLGHTHGIEFFSTIHDVAREAAQKIKAERKANTSTESGAYDFPFAFNRICLDETLEKQFPNLHGKLCELGRSTELLFSRGYCRAFWSAAREDLKKHFQKELSGEISSERADAAAEIADCVYLYCRVAQGLMKNDLV